MPVTFTYPVPGTPSTLCFTSILYTLSNSLSRESVRAQVYGNLLLENSSQKRYTNLSLFVSLSKIFSAISQRVCISVSRENAFFMVSSPYLSITALETSSNS